MKLSPRKKELLAFLRSHPGATARDMCNEFGFELATAYSHMSQLRDLGAVRKETGATIWFEATPEEKRSTSSVWDLAGGL